MSCLSRLAPSVTRVVICVYRAFRSTEQEKRETARSLALPLGKENPYTFFKFNPLYTNTPLIRPLSLPPSVFVLTRFDFTLFYAEISEIAKVKLNQIRFSTY